MWEPFKLLLPAYGVFWLFTFLIATCFWYGWTRVYQKPAFNWKVPALLSAFCGLVFCAYNFMTIYNNGALFAAQQRADAQSKQAQGGDTSKMDPALKMKADFLKSVESLLQDPSQITSVNKEKLFKNFATLWPNKEAKQGYYKSISAVYDCQKTFWEDALVSFKAKQTIKSDARKACEKMSGSFFNREKMIPEETIKNNEALIKEIASHNRLPAADGKTIEINDKMVSDAIDSQAGAIKNLKKIFE